MKIIKLSEITEKQPPCVVALGFFDGVHLGHGKILEKAVSEAKQLGVGSAVFTFSDSPDFKPGSLRIYPQNKRFSLLSKFGFDTLYTADFSEISDMPPLDFTDRILKERIGAVRAVCGYNFRFGRCASGDADTLVSAFGGCADVIGEERSGDAPVSSTLIRSLLESGKIEEANALLSEKYSLDGTVTHGNAVGRTIGIPTINIYFPENTVIPKRGVYVSRVTSGGREYPSVTNIGIRPTVGGDTVNCETHIIGEHLFLYGQEVAVTLLSYIREERKFDNIFKLKEQIIKDMEKAENYGK